MDPKMMEELKKNFELMKKKQIKIKKDDKENQENKKDNLSLIHI